MVLFAPFISAALLATFVVAIPVLPEDSAIGDEVAVSAPNGIILSETPAPQATAAGEASSTSVVVLSTTATTTSILTTTTSTLTTTALESTPTYGSGSSNFGSGFDSCIQQCVASFGSVGSFTPPASGEGGGGDKGNGNGGGDGNGKGAGSGKGASNANGATHTVIVAPTQGVLRYVPFAVNASVGDTVMFMWGANNHTVTKSSELQLCNKSSDAPFATGQQSKPFVFTQVVNDTNPTFFFCGTPTHCQKGMFGIINPPNAGGAPTSAAAMMPSLMNDSTLAAMSAYTDMQTENNSLAANWGSSLDMGKMPGWAQPFMAENILFSRSFLAANPEVLNPDGTVNLGNAGGNPMVIPMDIAQSINNAGNSSSSSTNSSSSASSSATASGASSTPTAASATKSNGGRSLGSSSALVGVVAIAATLLIL